MQIYHEKTNISKGYKEIWKMFLDGMTSSFKVVISF